MTNIISNNFSSALVGKILVATPYCEREACFKKSIVCILADDEHGTLGVVVNKQIQGLTPEFIYTALDVKIDNDVRQANKQILFGGPTETEKGLIIHSEEYQSNTLIHLPQGLIVSSDIEILTDIANGCGPKEYQIIIGYSGWEPGALEEEVKKNEWIILPFSNELVFGESHENKWNIAINSIGISHTCFTSTFGKA